MTVDKQYDAIVVGAGPAGSATASLLARDGFKVLLLDRAAFPRDKACGEYTSPETEQVLKRIGALDAVEQSGVRRLCSMRVISPSGHAFSMDYSPTGTEGSRYILATTRSVLDATLLDHARRMGAEVREHEKVEGISMRDGRSAGVLLRTRDGPVREEQARLIVGADGVHSVVVRSLGLTAPLLWPQSLGRVAHYQGYRGLDDWGEMHVSRSGYAGLAPQADGTVNVGLVMPMRRSANTHGGGATARFEQFAHSFPGVRQALQGAQRVTTVRGVGPLGARVRRTSGPGYLLVGDAAGFFDPFTGEGVYQALRGAEFAAQVASDALLQDDLTARSLARYSALRRREFGPKELFCRLVQLFVGLPPAMDYVVERLGTRTELRHVLTAVLGDYLDARVALRPAFLWSLLRP